MNSSSLLSQIHAAIDIDAPEMAFEHINNCTSATELLSAYESISPLPSPAASTVAWFLEVRLAELNPK